LTSVSPPIEAAFLELSVFRLDRHGKPEVMRIDVHPILDSAGLTPWVEGNGSEAVGFPSACTNVDDAFGVAWENPDGNNAVKPQITARPIASHTVLPDEVLKSGDILSWDITDLVNMWLEGTLENNGVALVEGLDGTVFQEIYFGSREGEIHAYDVVQVQTDGPRLRIKTGKDGPSLMM
jgi:hypothetical protein